MRIYQETVKLIDKEDHDLDELLGNLKILEQKIEKITELDGQMLKTMLDENIPDVDVDEEVVRADEIQSKYYRLKSKIERINNRESIPALDKMEASSCPSYNKRKVKLPSIELKRFSGDIKEWLPFWSQYNRIHIDKSIEVEDKFSYLFQATVPNSRARQIVESYLPTPDNYPRVIDSLKSRFGREDLLVEVYVRELLKLVLGNLNSKLNLTTLYDKIETQLRSLETLGVNSDKCAAMLYPLIESCLPEDIMRAWQRSTAYDSSCTLKSRLDKLMDFLRKEVENEERISLAMSSFQNKKRTEISMNKSTLPTTSALINNNDKSPKCVFCKHTHFSSNCDDSSIKNLSLHEKRKILIANGRCYLCLKFGHIARRCSMKIVCAACKGKHATVMCHNRSDDIPNRITPNHTTVENLSNTTLDQTFLQTLIVKLCNGSQYSTVRAIIDTGSQRSYIAKHTAVEMGYDSISSEQIVHALFGGEYSEIIDHNCYRITLQNLKETYRCNLNVLDQSVICGQVRSIRDGVWKNELDKLGVTITDIQDGPIEILLGADVAGKLFTGNKHTLSCGLTALETKLGWTVMGKVPYESIDVARSSSLIITSLFCHNDISQLWNFDILGIVDPKEKKDKKQLEDDIMTEFLKNITVNDEDRYEVGLSWIEGHPPLPNNFNAAKRRLDCLMKKLEKDGYYDTYNEVFDEWIGEGVIEIISKRDDDLGYFLPHRHVVKLNSTTTKLRPVFDASAKENNKPSLNQCLEKGLNFIEMIPSLLTRFRLSRIGVVSDIKKAFLQISLKESDRIFLKFLWYDKEGQLIFFRHARVVFGITCSPFLLSAVIKYHLENLMKDPDSKFSKSVLEKLMGSFYVDNCVTSVDTEEDLHQFIEESSEIMMKGKFDLRGWEYSLLGEERDAFHIALTPVLGLIWDRKSDHLKINFDWLQNVKTDVITKRSILSAAHRLFDPIGFSSPVQISPRLLLQKTWMLKLKWDCEVSEEIKVEFLKWLKELQILSEMEIPRWLLKVESNDWSLHMFCDASKSAYAAVVFLCCQCDNDIHCQLVQAKNRVAPIKFISIPRLELMAATIGARLLNSVMEDFRPDFKIYCWTDSSTVLSWIRKEDCWKTFVWNRVHEIRSLTSKDCWLHVPTHLNPADLPSRGCSAKQLLLSKWWEGPTWLKNQENWPKQNYFIKEDEVYEEKKKEVTTLLNCDNSDDCSSFYTYFSDYQKNLNQIAWLKRFIFNCRNVNNRREGILTLEEIEDAERVLIKMVQKIEFGDSENKNISSLNIFKDENGILRVKTKLTERNDSTDFIYPVLLPSQHFVTEKIIFCYHLKLYHIGVQGLLCYLREKFWIIKGRRTVKRIISKCSICQRLNARKLDSPPVGLPYDRVRDAAVFEIVGVDLAGPLYTKNNEKVWICLFTCAVYRAVHLEIVSSLSTETFLLAFRRFIARRGRPSVIYSDNGKNFIGAEHFLKLVDWNIIEKESIVQRIKWKFNPPGAAWWGGWWERLIRILKQLLCKQLQRACLSNEELSSVICDCEAIINSRPLTYVSEDSEDLITLTPSMFLQEVKEIGIPDLDSIDASSLRRHLKYIHKIRCNLRKRFRKEYLSQLRLFRVKCRSKKFKIGDVVMIENENLKRLDWPMAVINEMIPGKDGEIRLVRLRTATGELLRPIQRIYPLEIDSQDLEIKTILENQSKKKLKKEISKNTKTNKKGKLMPNDHKVSHLNPIKSDEEENTMQITRYGRRVKPPNRLQM